MDPNQVKELDIITTVIRFAAQVDTYQIRGIKDTKIKIMACYIARKFTGCHPRQIAGYFQIYPDYMENRLNEVAIYFLMHPEGLETIEKLGRLFRELNAAKI